MSEHTPTPYLIGKPDREWNEFIKICNEISADQMHHEARVITFGSDPSDPNYRIICLLGPGPHAHDNAEFIVEACNSHAKLIAENKRLREALNKIAYEPIGPTDASPTEVLQGCVDIARQALNERE